MIKRIKPELFTEQYLNPKLHHESLNLIHAAKTNVIHLKKGIKSLL